MKSPQQQNTSTQNEDCNRVRVKRGRGKEWEVEITSKSDYVVLAIWFSTLIAGFIVLYFLAV